jgi:RHS repeat-associated protein
MPVAVATGGETYYLTYDQVGSLRVVADSAGNVVKRIDYDSFGNMIADTNEDFKIPFGFAGGLHDCDTGLVRFGYRDYDPDVGCWTAKDPIFFAGGDTDLYGYVLNDPVNLADPNGLYTWPYTWKGWAGAILIPVGVGVIAAGSPVIGVGVMVVGAGFTVWDLLEGINQATADTKASVREMIKAKIDQAGGNAKWLQEMGIIPSNNQLKNLGFTVEELREFGLFDDGSPCP